MTNPRLRTVSPEWDRFDELLDLSFCELYEPFGVPRDADWFQPSGDSVFMVALSSDGELLGSARLMPWSGDAARQVRQVVVSQTARSHGVGRLLMTAVEGYAAEQRATGIWLLARDSAFGFYAALGYVPEGPLFESALTGIPHRRMTRSLR